MFRLKGLVVLVLACACAFAQASFELLLVADNGANTSFSDRKIHRFDPVTGTYLGNFGGFANAITSTHINQATNSLFVTTGFEMTEWDYNTGLMKGHYALGGSLWQAAVNPSGTRRLAFDLFSNILVYDFPFGGLPNAIAFGGNNYASGVFIDDTTIITYDNGINRFRTITTNAAVTTGAISLTTTSALGATGYGQMSRVGGANFVVMPGAEGMFHHYSPGSLGSGTSSIPGGGQGLGAAAAHSGFFISSTLGGVGTVTAFTNGFRPTRQFGSSVLRQPVSMQTVLAPEPGTMAALGLGALALLRRRRKS